MKINERNRIITDGVSRAASEYDGVSRAASEYKEKKYKYDAFISYRHLEPDSSVAQAIHNMIETFRAPKEFYIDGKRPKFRVFRDREELTNRDLTDSIEDALRNSKYLIVVCSKATPLSEWCIKEIQTFRKLHGDDRIIPILLEGEPEDAFPWPLKELKRYGDGGVELTQNILAADLRPDEILSGKIFYDEIRESNIDLLDKLKSKTIKLLKKEKYRIMATILKCSYGDLKQRDKERTNRFIITISSSVVTILLIFISIIYNAYKNAEIARKEAVETRSNIILKDAKTLMNEGDKIKSILLSKEATSLMETNMDSYNDLIIEEQRILNNSVYSNGVNTITDIKTKSEKGLVDIRNDGEHAAYVYENSKVGISDTANGALYKVLTGHDQSINYLKYSPDGRYLLSGGYDGKIMVFDSQTYEKVKEINNLSSAIYNQFSNDGKKLLSVVLENEDILIDIFSCDSWEKESRIIIKEKLSGIYLNHDGSQILVLLKSKSQDQLTIRSVKDGKILKTIPLQKLDQNNLINFSGTGLEKFQMYTNAKFSDNGKGVYALTNNRIYYFDIESLKSIEINSGLSEFTNIIEDTDKNIMLFSNGYNVYIIDLKDGTVREKIDFFEIYKAFTYNPKNGTVITASDNTISVWKDGTMIHQKAKVGNIIPKYIDTSYDGSKLFIYSEINQLVRIVDLMPSDNYSEIPLKLYSISSDKTKYVGYDGVDYYVVDDRGNSTKVDLSKSLGDKYLLYKKYFQISNDGKHILKYEKWVPDRKYTDIKPRTIIRCIDVEKNSDSIFLESNEITGFEITPDSKNVIVNILNKKLEMYNIDTKKKSKDFPNISTADFSISEDGSVIIAINGIGTSDVYSFEDGKLLDETKGRVLFASKNGEDLEIYGINNNELYERKNGKNTSIEMDSVLSSIPKSENDIYSFNKNKMLLLLVSNYDSNKKINLIDFKTGKSILNIEFLYQYYVRCLGYISGDGKNIIFDGNYYQNLQKEPKISKEKFTISKYKIYDKDELKSQTENLLKGRNLTDEERFEQGLKPSKK